MQILYAKPSCDFCDVYEEGILDELVARGGGGKQVLYFADEETGRNCMAQAR